MAAQALPLSHIRVVDLTQVIAGTVMTAWMAQMGAQVIKVESSLRPDLLRRDPSVDPRTALFMACNLGKKGCTINLREDEGRQLLLKLVSISDIVTENFTSGTMDRMGLGYEDLKRVKPDIILGSVSGFGRTGPARTSAAYANIASAFGGMSHLAGYPEEVPANVGGSWGDIIPSKAALLALLAALHHRRMTGEGAWIDISMSEVLASFIPASIVDYVFNGRTGTRRGNEEPYRAPHNVYRCAGNDRWIAISAASDEQWVALCDVIGRPELAGDPAFGDAYLRWQNRAALDPVIESWTSTVDAIEAMELLQGRGVPASVTATVEDLLADAHLRERGILQTLNRREGHPLTFLHPPGLFDSQPSALIEQPPALGEHNDLVFRGILGLSSDEVESLVARRVIF